jgi:hypothetical protein
MGPPFYKFLDPYYLLLLFYCSYSFFSGCFLLGDEDITIWDMGGWSGGRHPSKESHDLLDIMVASHMLVVIHCNTITLQGCSKQGTEQVSNGWP